MKIRVTGIVLLMIAFMMLAQVNCGRKTQQQGSPSYASLDTSVHYTGMETCKGCHQDIYNSYVNTGMGLSIDHASREKTSADFSRHPVVYDKYSDFYYQPFWDNDSLVFLEFRMDGKDTIYKRKETISYIIGSGQHTNSHIYNVNGYLHQAPLTFYTQQGRWDLPPGYENGNNTRFDRIIGLECMSCHNAYPKLELGSQNKYSAVPNGIDCERCHGPGSRHVEEKKAGKLVDVKTQIDYSIVNPAKLSDDKQMDVCQRCHIQGNAVLNEGKSFYDFRPGMSLSEVMNVFMPLYSGSEEHIMASHAERLKSSACYIATKATSEKNDKSHLFSNALTCITCHDPHVSRKAMPAGFFNGKCAGCHGGNNQTSCTEKVTVRMKVMDNCITCHMPENSTTDIPHVSVHDHKIRIPLNDTTIKKIKAFAGITAINNSRPPSGAVAQAYINYFEKFGMGMQMLDSALLYLPSATEAHLKQNIDKLIHVYFLKQDYAKLIQTVNRYGDIYSLLNKKSYDNKDAWTSYRIAEAYKYTGNGAAAERYYQRSYELAPLDPSFANEYGEQLAANRRFNEARGVFNQTISMHPLFAPAYSNLGYLQASIYNNTAAALKLYDQALALDPDYVTALLNKASLRMVTGDIKDARALLRRVIKADPLNKKAAAALKQLEGI